MTQNRENFILIRHIIKQYDISSKELFTEYTLTIKQHSPSSSSPKESWSIEIWFSFFVAGYNPPAPSKAASVDERLQARSCLTSIELHFSFIHSQKFSIINNVGKKWQWSWAYRRAPPPRKAGV
jgi:hypothetical protein